MKKLKLFCYYLFIYLFNNLFKVDKFTKIQYTYIHKSSQTNWLIKVNYPILQKKSSDLSDKNKRKRKQKKSNRFVKYHKIKYTKPTWKTYVRHRWQGQFIGFHFLIALLKEATESTFLISTGTSSQILGARWDNVSEPKVTDFIDLEWNFLLFLVL